MQGSDKLSYLRSGLGSRGFAKIWIPSQSRLGPCPLALQRARGNLCKGLPRTSGAALGITTHSRLSNRKPRPKVVTQSRTGHELGLTSCCSHKASPSVVMAPLFPGRYPTRKPRRITQAPARNASSGQPAHEHTLPQAKTGLLLRNLN